MYETKKLSETTIEYTFKTNSYANTIFKIIFASKLLHSYKPDSNGVWIETKKPRLNASIGAFTKELKWTKTSESVLKVESKNKISNSQLKNLKKTIDSFLIPTNPKDVFSAKLYRFNIVNHTDRSVYTYSFYSRGRAIIALCVLWDMKSHPRDDFEVHLTGKGRSYGDPSKMCDELRNQGFPRETDQSVNGTFLSVSRSAAYSGKQEHYQLLNKDQSLEDMVGRSNIPKKYKEKLFKSQHNQCQVCGNKYEYKYLAPDHKIPSIVQHDNLSKSNFLQKLQTLCVRCNQVKREACKKCPYEKKCSLCEWAYPEKNGINISILKQLKKLASKRKISINELIKDQITNIK